MTTALQDAYAPGIRRREEIVARDYCGGTPAHQIHDTADAQPRFINTLAQTTKQVAPGGLVAVGATVVVMQTVASEITLNGEPMTVDVGFMAAFLGGMMVVATLLTAGLRYKVQTGAMGR